MHFDPQSNKFTSVSYRGSVTVDYCVVPTTVFNLITTFKTELIHHVIDKYDMHVDGNIPWELQSSSSVSNTPLDFTPSLIRLPQQTIPQGFLESDKALYLIDNIQSSLSTGSNVNVVYESLCTLISQELPSPLDNINSCKSKKDKISRRPFHKSWWDSDLQSKRKEVRHELKVWFKSKFITSLKFAYQILQHEFD